MDSFPLHLPPIYYIYCREITPVDGTRVHVHCRSTHTNAILKAQCLVQSLEAHTLNNIGSIEGTLQYYYHAASGEPLQGSL